MHRDSKQKKKILDRKVVGIARIQCALNFFIYATLICQCLHKYLNLSYFRTIYLILLRGWNMNKMFLSIYCYRRVQQETESRCRVRLNGLSCIWIQCWKSPPTNLRQACLKPGEQSTKYCLTCLSRNCWIRVPHDSFKFVLCAWIALICVVFLTSL